MIKLIAFLLSIFFALEAAALEIGDLDGDPCADDEYSKFITPAELKAANICEGLPDDFGTPEFITGNCSTPNKPVLADTPTVTDSRKAVLEFKKQQIAELENKLGADGLTTDEQLKLKYLKEDKLSLENQIAGKQEAPAPVAAAVRKPASAPVKKAVDPLSDPNLDAKDRRALAAKAEAENINAQDKRLMEQGQKREEIRAKIKKDEEAWQKKIKSESSYFAVFKEVGKETAAGAAEGAYQTGKKIIKGAQEPWEDGAATKLAVGAGKAVYNGAKAVASLPGKAGEAASEYIYDKRNGDADALAATGKARVKPVDNRTWDEKTVDVLDKGATVLIPNYAATKQLRHCEGEKCGEAFQAAAVGTAVTIAAPVAGRYVGGLISGEKAVEVGARVTNGVRAAEAGAAAETQAVRQGGQVAAREAGLTAERQALAETRRVAAQRAEQQIEADVRLAQQERRAVGEYQNQQRVLREQQEAAARNRPLTPDEQQAKKVYEDGLRRQAAENNAAYEVERRAVEQRAAANGRSAESQRAVENANAQLENQNQIRSAAESSQRIAENNRRLAQMEKEAAQLAREREAIATYQRQQAEQAAAKQAREAAQLAKEREALANYQRQQAEQALNQRAQQSGRTVQAQRALEAATQKGTERFVDETVRQPASLPPR